MQPTIYGEAMIRHSRMALTSLSHAHDDIAALKSGLSGQVNVGAILSPSIVLLPSAIARVKQHSPMLRIGVEVESSNILLERLQRGTLDFLVARIMERSDSNLEYEELSDEPMCLVARVDHPLRHVSNLQLKDIANSGWILPPKGSVLRHRVEMMFHKEGLPPPANVIDTTAILVIISLLQQTDYLYVMPTEIAHFYININVLTILSIDLPCKMDGFGIIARRLQILSPSATILRQAIRDVAREIY